MQRTLFVAQVNRTHHCTQIAGKELQDVAAQQLRAELADDLLGQLRLPTAQPCLALQAFGAGTQRIQVFAILCRQGQQIAAPKPGQESTQHHYEQQVSGNGHHDRIADCFGAGYTQLLFGGNEGVVFTAHFVG